MILKQFIKLRFTNPKRLLKEIRGRLALTYDLGFKSRYWYTGGMYYKTYNSRNLRISMMS